MQFRSWTIEPTAIEGLIRRAEQVEPLLKRCVEEQVTACVGLDADAMEALEQQFLEQHKLADEEAREAWLAQRGWTREDLLLHLSRPEALKRFAEQRFGPGLEEHFLQRKGSLDTVLYSLLRVRDPGLARELWIQISEGEVRFEDAAAQHSDGPEARSRGLLGPMPLGQLQPELAERLRHLQQGDLRPPERIGPWWLLLRLEQLNPARLDEAMRQRLLQEQLDTWLNARVDSLLAGEQPEELHYDQSP